MCYTGISFNFVHKLLYYSRLKAGLISKKSIILTYLSYIPFRYLANDYFVSEMSAGDTEEGKEPILVIVSKSTSFEISLIIFPTMVFSIWGRFFYVCFFSCMPTYMLFNYIASVRGLSFIFFSFFKPFYLYCNSYRLNLENLGLGIMLFYY